MGQIKLYWNIDPFVHLLTLSFIYTLSDPVFNSR